MTTRTAPPPPSRKVAAAVAALLADAPPPTDEAAWEDAAWEVRAAAEERGVRGDLAHLVVLSDVASRLGWRFPGPPDPPVWQRGWDRTRP